MPHRTALTLALAALAAPAHAEPAIDYAVGVSLEHSDNINYSSTDPVSEDVLIPRLDFRVDQEGAALSASAAGSFEYRDYLGGAFGNEFRALLSGIANWHISPDRLDWYFADNASQQPINVLQSDAPSNQQQTNVFTTGPTLRAKFSDALRGRLDVRYTNSYADTSKEFNSNRLSAVGSLLYRLDPADTLSASAATARTRYVETVSEPFDYDRHDVYAAFQRSTRVLALDLAAGYSWLDIRSGDGPSGSLLRGSLRWNLSPATSLGVSAAHEYADASQDLVATPDQLGHVGIGSGLGSTVLTPQVYREDRVGLDFSHVETTYRVGFSPFWRKLDYVGDPASNQRTSGYYADAQYYVRPTLWLAAYAGQERRRYETLARTDDDLRYGLSLNLQRTRHWLWSLLFEHQRRDSDVPGAGYSENSIMLTLTWKR
jgi:hypothetical protein